MPTRSSRFWRLGIMPLLIAVFVGALFAEQDLGYQPDTRDKDEPQPIYAENSNDAWNRVFYHLFSRRVEARLSSEFPEGAPFTEIPSYGLGAPTLHVSTRLFERMETGDRAIDPLYPSFFSSIGPKQVLTDPQYPLLIRALRDAQNEKIRRPVIARALMQSDLWSAFDIVHAREFSGVDGKQLNQRRQVVLELLAQLIRKIALTPKEIKALPDNYTLSAARFSLPNFFSANSGWMEVHWFPERLHDRSADFRRVARIFIKPTYPPQDKQKFLDTLRNPQENRVTALDGVALVTRLLLIDAQGTLTPTRLTSEIQVRIFAKTRAGTFKMTEIRDCELSRRLFVSHPESGGFVQQDGSAPAYLPASGNDYAFASRQFGNDVLVPPILITLRTRCTLCHGSDLTSVLTFQMHASPPIPPVRLLNPVANDAAGYVISRKVRRRDWKALRQYWDAGSAIASAH